MGISGLLPFVKKASRPCFLREFNGSVAVVDTYCWLHKGAFTCAEKLVRGEDTDGYVVYVMKMVHLLLSHRIKPIMVFDGCNLPSKAGTEAKRRESRAKNRALAKELLREGRTREARECFQRCIDVTSHMARAVMTACRQINVDVIVAPYEADAQLAYLVQAGFADLVITEDSDLILFGCERVIFKLDSSGGGVLVEQNKLHLAMSIPPHKFSLEMFRHMCVLSGCDYLPSLPGIGLAKACKFFKLTSDTDVFNALCKLPSYLKLPQLEVPLEYREGFRRAVFTFLHQLVFCPRERLLRPLIEPDDGSEPSDHPYAGAFIGHERALQIALGNIDVQSGHQVDHFDPDRHKESTRSGGRRRREQRGSPLPQPTLERQQPPRLASGGLGIYIRGTGSPFPQSATGSRRSNISSRPLPSSVRSALAPAMKSSGWDTSGDKVAEYSSIWQPDYDRNAFRERCAADRKGGRGGGLTAFVANNTRRRDNVVRDGGVGQKEEKGALNSSKEKKKTGQRGEVKKVMDIKSLFAKRKREIEDEASDSISDLLALYRCPTKTPKNEAPDETPPAACRSPGGKEETSATPNLLAKYRRSPSKNPFAKKKPDNIDQRLKTIESLSINKVEDVYPVTARDADTNNEALRDTKSLPYCSTTRLKRDVDFNMDDAKNILLEDVSGITDVKTIKEKEMDCKAAISSVAAEEETTTSKSLADINVLARMQGRNVIIKSKYFRPAGCAPACSAVKSNYVEVVAKTSDNRHCGKDATTAKDSPTVFFALSTSISIPRGAQTIQRDSDEDQGETNNPSSSARRRETLLCSSSLSRRFSYQSTKLDSTSSYDDVQSPLANDRVSSPTRNSIDDPTSCGPDEAGPSSPILSRKASFERRAHESLPKRYERSDRESSTRADVTEYPLGGGCSELKDDDSLAPCSEGFRDSQASVGGSSAAGATQSSQRSYRSELLDDSCDNESFGLTPLPTVEKRGRDLGSIETWDLVSLSSDDGGANLGTGDDNDEVANDGVESHENSQSLKEARKGNLSSFESRFKFKSLKESELANLSKSESISNFGDPDSDDAMQSSIEEESPYETNRLQSENISGNSVECSRGGSDMAEVCDDLPTQLLGKAVSPALVKQQREILMALENKSLQTSTSSSPYFSKMPGSAVKPGSCRRPGLSRPAKGGRQLNLRDMFALKR